MRRIGLILCLWASPALSEIEMRFVEGAPKDRFVLTNLGDCTIPSGVVVLDLSGSEGGLIFDTEGTGAGVQVYQPLQIVEGSAFLQEPPVVADGAQVLELKVRALPPRGTVAFTIDVDDTRGTRQTVVSGAEITGAELRFGAKTATFDAAAKATMPGTACLS